MDSCLVPNDLLLGEVSELLSEGKEVIIKTKGSSMLPFIRGDRDSVKLLKKEPLQVGDIALALTGPGRYVLHRIIALDSDEVTLMGDGNLRGTERCRAEDVKGCVIQILDEDGKPRPLSDGKVWRRLKPFRRIILGIYRRLI